MAQKAVLVVLSKPTSEGEADAYNDWYDNTHIDEVLQVPGIVACKRYRESSVQSDPPGSLGNQKYLALYEIEADDLASIPGELERRAVDGRFNMNGPIEMDPPPTVVLFDAV